MSPTLPVPLGVLLPPLELGALLLPELEGVPLGGLPWGVLPDVLEGVLEPLLGALEGADAGVEVLTLGADADGVVILNLLVVY